MDVYGCCLNAMNITSDESDIQHLVTRYDLWTACGVEMPGFCSDLSMTTSKLLINRYSEQSMSERGGTFFKAMIYEKMHNSQQYAHLNIQVYLEIFLRIAPDL